MIYPVNDDAGQRDNPIYNERYDKLNGYHTLVACCQQHKNHHVSISLIGRY